MSHLLRPLVFVLALGLARAQFPSARDVAAPPADILSGLVRLPDPARAATRSQSLVQPLDFVRAGAGWTAELGLPVDAPGALALALLAPDAGALALAFDAGTSAWTTPDAWPGARKRQGLAGEELAGWTFARWDLERAPAGVWRLRVESQAGRAPGPAWLLARTAGEHELDAWVTTHELLSDAPIGIVARLAPAAAVDEAALFVQDGARRERIALADDGEHEDGARGDGLYGALVPKGWSGALRARVELAGSTSAGLRFRRSLEIAFPVLERALLLDGGLGISARTDGRLELALRALPLAPVQRLHVSAELWGTDAGGVRVPVCWLSRMLEPREREGAWELPLALDPRWIELARAGEPFELRELRVQDPDSEVVFDRLASLRVAAGSLPSGLAGGTDAITPEMLSGSSALTLAGFGAGPHAPARLFNPALMLVHGYCSSASIWPAADFTQPKLEFLDPDANRSHDQFALLIAQRGQSATLGSFGVVAHSQGGPAALHLLTYYESGLDHAHGARRIQSVASPYQGTPLASWGGFACGVNSDMTPSGSTTWLAGIPGWARAEVWYWTTSNSGSACHWATDFLLSNPEDGTVEQSRGQLPGANNQGHTTGWCHTTGMSNPANYTDHARNLGMDSAAAR